MTCAQSAASLSFRSVLKEDLDESVNVYTRFIVKQLDYELEFSMGDQLSRIQIEYK